METSTNHNSSDFGNAEIQETTTYSNTNTRVANVPESTKGEMTEENFFQKITTKLDRVCARVMGIQM